MDTSHEIVAALVANALDDIEAERLDVATALRLVAEAAWLGSPMLRQPAPVPATSPAVKAAAG